jgi:hypothetical protein
MIKNNLLLDEQEFGFPQEKDDMMDRITTHRVLHLSIHAE